MATLRAVDGRLISSRKGNREILAERHERMSTPSENTTFVSKEKGLIQKEQ